jgi:hypothetical protein
LKSPCKRISLLGKSAAYVTEISQNMDKKQKEAFKALNIKMPK